MPWAVKGSGAGGGYDVFDHDRAEVVGWRAGRAGLPACLPSARYLYVGDIGQHDASPMAIMRTYSSPVQVLVYRLMFEDGVFILEVTRDECDKAHGLPVFEPALRGCAPDGSMRS